MSTNIVGQENLPNVYIKQVTIGQSANKLKISSKVCLYDISDGSWYLEEDLRLNMKVLIVLSSSESFTQQIVTGRDSLTPDNLKSIDGYNRRQVKHKIYSISAVNRAAFENELDNGHVVFPYKCSFRVKEQPNMSLFAVCYLDTKQFSSQNNLNLSSKSVSLYHGAVVGEQIFVNGQVPNNTNLFTKADGALHVGPVYTNSGAYLAGSTFSATRQNTLQLSSATNTKIKDYRIRYKTKRRNKMNIKEKPVFSDLYSSVDSLGKVRSFFEMDMDLLYANTSAYAKLFMSLDRSLYDLAVEHISLSDVSIYSQRVLERMQSSGAGTAKYKLKPVGYRKRIINTKEQRRGLQTKEENSAKIQEIDTDLGKNQASESNDRKRRTICFSQDKTRFTRGKLMYSVEVSYKDPSEKIILDMLHRASEGLSTLRNYRQRAKRVTNYNYYAGQTKPNLYGGTGANAWRRSIKEFMHMYKLMFDTSDVDIDRLTANLIVMVHPRTLTMKSLDWFCEQYSYVYNRMSKYFKSINHSLAPELKVGYVKTDMQKGKLSIENKFKHCVDLSDYRMSIGFTPKSLVGDIDEDLTFPVLSYANIRAMARAERLRFFSENPAFTSQMVPDLKQEMIDQLNNLDYNSYTYFSPSNMTQGERNSLNFEKLETADLQAFNKLYNKPVEYKYRAGYKAASKRQEAIRAGRKSSFYIKASKRESEDVEEYKSSDENLGSESVFVEAKNEEQRVDSPNLNQETKSRFASYERAKQSNHHISFEEFNLRNQKNILSQTMDKKIDEPKLKRIVRGIPLHLKALLGSEYGFAKNNIFYGHEDLMQDTQVRDFIKTCFLSLVKIQYLVDYEENSFRNPKWRDLTSYSFNSLVVKRNKTVLCRFLPYDNATLKLETDLFDRMGLENKYFLISKNPNMDSLAIKGRTVNNKGTVVVGREALVKQKVDKIIDEFENKSGLNGGDVQMSSYSLVVAQPTSKNGPLKQVDYRKVNDLVGSPRRQASTTMSSNTTPTGGGAY